MHYNRYDELDLLRAELDQEDRIRESLDWSSGELERSIAELEQYVKELDEGSKGVDDNEWKVRFESQVALNKQLAEQKDWLETELAEARRKLTTGSYPDAMNFNLDALTEAELLRLVKHLERMRNDFYSTLRDTEWKLDKESKEFHHFDEMRRVYKSDLKHANAQLDRLKLTVMDTSGLVSPLYPAGYYRWLDAHTPIPGPSKSSSKSPSRKGEEERERGGGSKSRNQSRSPTRSKSRNEKQKQSPSKKKHVPQKREEEPGSEEEEGEGTTPTKSEVEQDQGASEEEDDGGGGGGGRDKQGGKSEGGGGGSELGSKEGSPSKKSPNKERRPSHNE